MAVLRPCKIQGNDRSGAVASCRRSRRRNRLIPRFKSKWFAEIVTCKFVMKLTLSIALLAFVLAAAAAIPLSDSAVDADLQFDNAVSQEAVAFEDSGDLDVEAASLAPPAKGLVCAPGTAPSSAGLRCVDCSSGTYSAGGTSPCQVCPAGSMSAAKAASCTMCPAGSFSASSGSQKCTLCPVGSYSVGAGSVGCEACPANQLTSSTGSTSSSKCERCPPGSVFSNSFYGFVCAKCPPNTYWNAETLKCSNCGAGTEFTGTGATSSSSCTRCPAGSASFLGKDGVSCTTCDAGSFAVAGQRTCQYCPRGTFGDKTGASACTPCPANTYGQGSGARICVSCPLERPFSADGLTCCSTAKWHAASKTCAN